jgi:hypothetical protein
MELAGLVLLFSAAAIALLFWGRRNANGPLIALVILAVIFAAASHLGHRF